MKVIATLCTAASISAHWDGALKGHYALHHYQKSGQLINAAEESGAVVIFHRDSSPSPAEDIRAILGADPTLRILVLSDVPSFQEGDALLRMGIKGYGNARLHPVALLQALAVIGEGNHWYYPEFMQHLIQAAVQNSGDASGESLLAGLSERERETALMVADGLSNKEIAARMGITERTVKAHLGAIFAKLGVKDRVGLILRIRGR